MYAAVVDPPLLMTALASDLAVIRTDGRGTAYSWYAAEAMLAVPASLVNTPGFELTTIR